jgi:hypothetical protein
MCVCGARATRFFNHHNGESGARARGRERAPLQRAPMQPAQRSLPSSGWIATVVALLMAGGRQADVRKNAGDPILGFAKLNDALSRFGLAANRLKPCSGFLAAATRLSRGGESCFEHEILCSPATPFPL